MYVYMKCVLTNGFMRSSSLDLVHRGVGLEGTTCYFSPIGEFLSVDVGNNESGEI